MTKPGVPHSVQLISCPYCQSKMVVQYEKRIGAGAMVEEIIACVKCKKEFNVLLLGPIVGGPFSE